jgi:hypothetical protein
VIEFAKVTPAAFRDFAEPGYAKTIYSLSVRPLAQQQTVLSGMMRTATTDEHARRWFRVPPSPACRTGRASGRPVTRRVTSRTFDRVTGP